MSSPPIGPIKLTYFAIEGVAEKVRLALTLGGIKFEDERVGFDHWEEMKSKTKFEQLPFMTIGDSEPVTQSGAMLRFAGQLSGLYPSDKVLQIEEVIGLEEDLGRTLAPSMLIGRKPASCGHPEDMPQEQRTELQLLLRAKLMEPNGDLMRMLGYFEAMLADGREFVCGAAATIADCQVIPRLRHLKKGILDGIPVTVVDSFPRLNAYYSRFHAIKAVQAYHAKLEAKA